MVCDAAVTMTATLSKMRPVSQARFNAASSYSTRDLASGPRDFSRNLGWKDPSTASNTNANSKSRNSTSSSSTGVTGSDTSNSTSSSSRGGAQRSRSGEGSSAKEGRSTAGLAQLVGRTLGVPGAALPCPSSTPLVQLCPLSVQSSLWMGLHESRMMVRILSRLKGIAGIQEVVTPVEGEKRGKLWMPLALRGRKGGGGSGTATPAWSDSVTVQTMAVKMLRLLLSVTHVWREQARASFEAKRSDWVEAFRVLCTHRSCYISTAAMSAVSAAVACCPALGAGLLEDESEGAMWPGVVRHVQQKKCPAAMAAAASLATRLVSIPAFCHVLRSADTNALAGALVPLMSASRCPADIGAHTVPSLSASSSSLLASLSSFGCTHTGPTRATIIAHESFPFPAMPAATTSSSFSTNQAALQAVVGLLRWPGAHRRAFLMHSLAHTLNSKLAHGWQSASGAKESGKEAGERRELIWSAVEWLARFSGGQQCLEDGTLSVPSASTRGKHKPQKNRTPALLKTPSPGATAGVDSLGGSCSDKSCAALGSASLEDRTSAAVPKAISSASNESDLGCYRAAGVTRSGSRGGSSTSEEESAAPDLFEYSLTHLIDATWYAVNPENSEP